jgi:hypothetical protein
MNAILDPRIAAARIHALVFGLQGAIAGRDRIAASSQGDFMTVMIAREYERIQLVKTKSTRQAL